MRKLILLFLIILSGIAFSQTKGKVVGEGAIWTDSLGYGTVVTSDSVWILNINFNYDHYRFFIKGNTSSPVDSIGLMPGSIRYDEMKNPVDTIWGSQVALEDSAGNTIYTIVNNTVGKDFTLVRSATQLLKLSLLNHRGGLITRNVTITVDAKK